jgi:hypothetical protein
MTRFLCSLMVLLLVPEPAASDPVPARVGFSARPAQGEVDVVLSNRAIATYVYNDARTARPFFRSLKTPTGFPVTRNHPPVAGADPTDHADMHPGLWMAFGDLSGNDFWRNKGPRVLHDRFISEPAGGDSRGGFTVTNRYVVNERTIAREITRFTILAQASGYLLVWDATLTPEGDGCEFGGQEEMGLGLRVATPITAKHGSGRITNSRGDVNEKGTWGKVADWCDYSAAIGARHIGVTLMADPAGRKIWFHSRDYGLLVANPFGTRAGGPERHHLARDQSLRLRFGICIRETQEPQTVERAYETFTHLLRDRDRGG